MCLFTFLGLPRYAVWHSARTQRFSLNHKELPPRSKSAACPRVGAGHRTSRITRQESGRIQARNSSRPVCRDRLVNDDAPFKSLAALGLMHDEPLPRSTPWFTSASAYTMTSCHLQPPGFQCCTPSSDRSCACCLPRAFWRRRYRSARLAALSISPVTACPPALGRTSKPTTNWWSS